MARGLLSNDRKRMFGENSWIAVAAAFTACRTRVSEPSLSFEHEQLTYRHGSRHFSLTDIPGRVIHQIAT